MYRAVQASPGLFGLIGGGGPACTQPAGIPERLVDERGIIGYAMFTGGLAQNDVTSYGAQVGVNVALNEWIAPKAF